MGVHWGTLMPQCRALGRVSLANSGEKTEDLVTSGCGINAELGFGMGCAVSTCHCAIWCEVLTMAATALHIYESLTFEERTTPDYVTSFL